MTERVHRYLDRLIDDREAEERICRECTESYYGPYGPEGRGPCCRAPKPKKEAK